MSASAVNHQVTINFRNIDIPIGSSVIVQYSNAWTLTSVTGFLAGDYC